MSKKGLRSGARFGADLMKARALVISRQITKLSQYEEIFLSYRALEHLLRKASLNGESSVKAGIRTQDLAIESS